MGSPKQIRLILQFALEILLVHYRAAMGKLRSMGQMQPSRPLVVVNKAKNFETFKLSQCCIYNWQPFIVSTYETENIPPRNTGEESILLFHCCLLNFLYSLFLFLYLYLFC